MNKLLTFASVLSAVLLLLLFPASPSTAQGDACYLLQPGYRWYPAGAYAGRYYPAGWYCYYGGCWYLYGYGYFSGYPIATISAPKHDRDKDNTVSIASFPDSHLQLRLVHHNRFKLVNLEAKPFMRHSVVLAEEKLTKDDSMAGISISIVDEWHFKNVTHVFSDKRQVKQHTIANYVVYEFPGFPAPYGEFAYYFLVKFEERQYLEIFASRYYPADTTRKTNYEKDIMQLIRTLKINKVASPPK